MSEQAVERALALIMHASSPSVQHPEQVAIVAVLIDIAVSLKIIAEAAQNAPGCPAFND